jgi:hypothetical protein
MTSGCGVRLIRQSDANNPSQEEMSAKPDGFNQGMLTTMCHQAPAAQNPKAAFAQE